jgi:hypothetical protein
MPFLEAYEYNAVPITTVMKVPMSGPTQLPLFTIVFSPLFTSTATFSSFDDYPGTGVKQTTTFAAKTISTFPSDAGIEFPAEVENLAISCGRSKKKRTKNVVRKTTNVVRKTTTNLEYTSNLEYSVTFPNPFDFLRVSAISSSPSTISLPSVPMTSKIGKLSSETSDPRIYWLLVSILCIVGFLFICFCVQCVRVFQNKIPCFKFINRKQPKTLNRKMSFEMTTLDHSCESVVIPPFSETIYSEIPRRKQYVKKRGSMDKKRGSMESLLNTDFKEIQLKEEEITVDVQIHSNSNDSDEVNKITTY